MLLEEGRSRPEVVAAREQVDLLQGWQTHAEYHGEARFGRSKLVIARSPHPHHATPTFGSSSGVCAGASVDVGKAGVPVVAFTAAVGVSGGGGAMTELCTVTGGVSSGPFARFRSRVSQSRSVGTANGPNSHERRAGGQAQEQFASCLASRHCLPYFPPSISPRLCTGMVVAAVAPLMLCGAPVLRLCDGHPLRLSPSQKARQTASPSFTFPLPRGVADRLAGPRLQLQHRAGELSLRQSREAPG